MVSGDARTDMVSGDMRVLSDMVSGDTGVFLLLEHLCYIYVLTFLSFFDLCYFSLNST